MHPRCNSAPRPSLRRAGTVETPMSADLLVPSVYVLRELSWTCHQLAQTTRHLRTRPRLQSAVYEVDTKRIGVLGAAVEAREKLITNIRWRRRRHRARRSERAADKANKESQAVAGPGRKVRGPADPGSRASSRESECQLVRAVLVWQRTTGETSSSRNTRPRARSR
jgi:hypothetical protein